MSENERMVKVWDAPTRVFHWLLVTLVALGLITGFISPEHWMGFHTWVGYSIGALVVFRLVWGIFGSKYSRIGSFAFAPIEVFKHFRGILTLRQSHYLGHDPTGAVIIFALVIFLVGIIVSGLLTLGGEENQGPLAGITRFPLGNASKGAHLYLVFGIMGMIVIHVIGVIAQCFLTRVNLVKSMFTGYKPLLKETPAFKHSDARPWSAVLSLVIFSVLSGAVLAFLGQMPPTGHQSLPEFPVYATECGDCHMVYHPSLLPEKSWKDLMAGLDDHFGENASLDEAMVRDITEYLSTYAGDYWDTEAANRFLIVDPKALGQISATPYWISKHSKITDSVFKQKNIRGKGNCAACHKDSASGRFDDQQINIPKVTRTHER